MTDTTYTIPPLILQALERYRDDRERPDSFLIAVLHNDLMLAIGLADQYSLTAIRDIIMWVRWEMPSSAHGSRLKVKAWLAGPQTGKDEGGAE